MMVYTSFIRNAFLAMLAYRLRYYTGIITYLLFVSVHYFIWRAVFADLPPDATIHGFTLAQMITYVAVGWIARSLYFSNIDEEVDDLVRTGQISVYLLRPVSFHAMMMSQAAGESLFRLCFFSLPIGLVILWAFPVSPPETFAAFLLFLLATAGSFIIFAEINFLVGLLAFATKSTQGVMRAKYYLVQLLSGLLLPLTFFPQSIQQILAVLPFKAITYVPLTLYLGKATNGEIVLLLAEQLLWCVVFVALSEYFWSRATASLTLQGG